MEYTIWLQILMELALAVSGEKEIGSLLKNTCRAFHQKLDCTHFVLYKNEEIGMKEVFISPHWAQNDDHFLSVSRKLSIQCNFDNEKCIGIEDKDHFYYGFLLQDYGTLCIARGKSISYKLVNELYPIMDMLANNILACDAFDKQIRVEKDLRKQKDYIEYLAYHDTLTTLPNRRKYIEMLETCIENKVSGGVVLLDLDNFKRINDTLGHVFGDEVLKYISRNLKRYSSDDLIVFRIGGDEFLLLIKEKTKKEIEDIIQHIFTDFSNITSIGTNKVDLTFSIGITMFPEDGVDMSQLFMNADLALYSVKNLHKNGYRFFDTNLSKEMLQRLTITNYLREAIHSDGFKLVYQPEIDLLSGEIKAYEALLRMKHHSTSPTEFIPIAEENQMIVEIGRIVTKMAIKQLRTWIDQGYQVKPIAINFSPIQIYDLHYLDFIKEQLELYQIDGNLLEIEITESIFIKNQNLTIAFLNQLKELGIRIALDDYGTGYSSLYYLTYLPLDKIKIARKVIHKFLDEDLKEVINSLISLSHNLGYAIVAEGVEKEEQFQILQSAECDIIQGFLFSKPLEVEEVENSFGSNYFERLSKYRMEEMTINNKTIDNKTISNNNPCEIMEYIEKKEGKKDCEIS